jgi:hypothetical protein
LLDVATVSCIQLNAINDAIGAMKTDITAFCRNCRNCILVTFILEKFDRICFPGLHISIASVNSYFTGFFFSHVTYELAEHGLRGAFEMLESALPFYESPAISGHVLPLTFEARQSLSGELVADRRVLLLWRHQTFGDLSLTRLALLPRNLIH